MDLVERASLAVREAGFLMEPPLDARRQAARVALPSASGSSTPDLRHLFWSSIDNATSRDLDQVEVAEELASGAIRVFVGIADVDALLPARTPLDKYAATNTTSVYTGVRVWPMLPETLSTSLTSFLQNQDRLAMVIQFEVSRSGEVSDISIQPAWVRNHARLVYEPVGAWLEHGESFPELTSALSEQLKLQAEAAHRLRNYRREQGAVAIETIETTPILAHGTVRELRLQRKNEARDLIESFMITVNSRIATFLEKSHFPSIQRLVKRPERWPRIRDLARGLGCELPEYPDAKALGDFMAERKRADPDQFADLSLTVVKLLGKGEYTVVKAGESGEPHFSLAVHDYTHSTAPNRRYVDIVIQRLLKALIAGARPPYSDAELESIAQHCMERESAARKVERLMKKVMAAQWLEGRIGQIFDAIVTGAAEKGTYARLISPPIEGRVMRGERGLDVGDRCRLRLTRVDTFLGHIDFEVV